MTVTATAHGFVAVEPAGRRLVDVHVGRGRIGRAAICVSAGTFGLGQRCHNGGVELPSDAVMLLVVGVAATALVLIALHQLDRRR